MFLLFERSKQLDFENYQINWWFFRNIQILDFMIVGGQKWFNFQENIIHIKMWPFIELLIKRNLALRKNIITLILCIFQCMKKKIWTWIAWCPRKRNDLFVSRSIVTSRKRLKRNQMICDYMQLIVVYNENWLHLQLKIISHIFWSHLWLCYNYL
jgi:hypothetical protein